jgi:hypothetical protein
MPLRLGTNIIINMIKVSYLGLLVVSVFFSFFGNASAQMPLLIGESRYYRYDFKEYALAFHRVSEPIFDHDAEVRSFVSAIKFAREHGLKDAMPGVKYMVIGIINDRQKGPGGEVAIMVSFSKLVDPNVDPLEVIRDAPRDTDWKNWWMPNGTNPFIRAHIEERIAKGEKPLDADILKTPGHPYATPPPPSWDK